MISRCAGAWKRAASLFREPRWGQSIRLMAQTLPIMNLKISTPTAFHTASLNPKTSVTQGTYDIWRNNNPNKRLNLNANKLANVRRDIVNRQVWSERDGITTPFERDANAVPEEQIANKKQQNDKNSESDVQDPLNIYRFTRWDSERDVMKESILQRYEIGK